SRVVAQRIYIGVPFSVFRPFGSRIMLNNEIVPIQKPHRTIGSNLCLYRTKPFISTGYKIPCIETFDKARSFLFHDMFMNQPSGRLINESYPIPILFRIGTSGIKTMPGCGSEPTVYIYLT